MYTESRSDRKFHLCITSGKIINDSRNIDNLLNEFRFSFCRCGIHIHIHILTLCTQMSRGQKYAASAIVFCGHSISFTFIFSYQSGTM